MIDPITAFATAQAAVAAIKKGIALGKDVQSLGSQLSAFFDAKDVVIRASTEARRKSKGDESSLDKRALENVLHARALAQAETDLKEFLIYSGQGDLYQQIVAERTRLKREAREAQERERAARRRIAARRRQIAEYVFLGLVIFGLAFFAVWGSIKLIWWWVGR